MRNIFLCLMNSCSGIMFSISSCGFSCSPHPFGCLRTYYPAFSCLGSGLEILAFPCNQFGAQEPGNNEQILEFACTRFKAEYPIFDKVWWYSVVSYLYSWDSQYLKDSFRESVYLWTLEKNKTRAKWGCIKVIVNLSPRLLDVY